MRAESVVNALLTQAPGLVALVGTRIYPVQAIQNGSYPQVIYEHISSTDIYPVSAQSGATMVEARIETTVVGKSYADCKNGLEQIRLALLFQRGTIAGVQVVWILRVSSNPDFFDPDLGLYKQSADWKVRFYEPSPS